MEQSPEKHGQQDPPVIETAKEKLDRLERQYPVRLGTFSFSQPWRPFGLRLFEGRRRGKRRGART